MPDPDANDEDVVFVFGGALIGAGGGGIEGPEPDACEACDAWEACEACELCEECPHGLNAPSLASGRANR